MAKLGKGKWRLGIIWCAPDAEEAAAVRNFAT